jgi:hypothetical protein
MVFYNMEWLLIIFLYLPPEQADIGDLRFSSKEECLQIGDQIVRRGLIPEPPQTEDETREKTGIKGLIFPVLRSEIQCVEVPKE